MLNYQRVAHFETKPETFFCVFRRPANRSNRWAPGQKNGLDLPVPTRYLIYRMTVELHCRSGTSWYISRLKHPNQDLHMQNLFKTQRWFLLAVPPTWLCTYNVLGQNGCSTDGVLANSDTRGVNLQHGLSMQIRQSLSCLACLKGVWKMLPWLLEDAGSFLAKHLPISNLQQSSVSRPLCV